MHRKAETGIQLLARLSTRVDLSDLDPLVFGKFPNPQQSLDGKVIEISGLEGVGKTEIVLHYVARTCMPCKWQGLNIGGLGAKVTIIDTEFKFSVLRLAIVIECLVLKYSNEKRTEECKKTSGDNKDYDSTKPYENLRKVMTCSNNELKIQDSEVKNVGSKALLQNSKDKNTSAELKEGLVITPLDMENIVHESLERVEVMKVTSSQQLVASLLSLEQRLSCDPQVAMIVIDTISSFYWTDQAFESSMAAIVQAIIRCKCEFGITFLVAKSLLVNPKVSKWEKEGGDCGDSSKSDSAEFLGRHWSSLSMRKIILSESASSQDKRQFLARCSEWSAVRSLSFIEDCLFFE